MSEEAQIDKLEIEISANIGAAAEGFKKLNSALNSLNRKVENSKFDTLYEKLKRISELDFSGIGKFTGLNEAIKRVDQLEKKLNDVVKAGSKPIVPEKVSQPTRKKTSVTEGDSVGDSSDKLADNVSKYNSAMQNLKSVMKDAGLRVQAPFNKVSMQIDEARKRLQTLNDLKISAPTNSAYEDQLKREIAYTQEEINQLEEKRKILLKDDGSGSQKKGFSSLFGSLKVGGTTLGSIQNKLEAIGGLGGSIGKIGTKLASGFSSALPLIGQVLTLFNMFARPWKETVKVGKVLLGLVEQIGDRLAESIKTKTSSFLAPVKSLLDNIKRVIFNRLIRELFNMIQNGMMEGLKNIAKGVSSANAVLSKYSTQIMYLKNSIAAALIPALQAVYPVFEAFTNVIIKASNALNQFMSALNGKATYTKAQKQYVDYAESVDSSSNKAKKSVQNLTASFDELNDITPTANDGEDMTAYFATGAIESSIGDFYKKITEGFENGDLSVVGTILANKLNSAIDKVDNLITGKWKEKANRWGRALGSFIGTAIDKINFTNIGKTIADGLNLITSSLLEFERKIDFKRLGEQLANGFTGLIMNINWKDLGELLLNKFLNLFDVLKGFTGKMLEPITTDDGKSKPRIVAMVENIIEGFKQAIGAAWDKFEDIGSTIGDMFIMIFEFGATLFQDSAFWGRLFMALTNMLDGLIKKLDNPSFRETLKSFIVNMADKVAQFITVLNRSGLINSIVDLMWDVFTDPQVHKALQQLFTALGELAGQWFKIKVFAWIGTVIGKVEGFFSGAKGFFGFNRLSVNGYATGGFPEEGQMFIARESGPELVGNMGGHTAVANNDQIMAGIENASYRGITRALAENGGMNSNNRSGSSQTVLNINGRKMAEALVDDMADAFNRKGVRLRTL